MPEPLLQFKDLEVAIDGQLFTGDASLRIRNAVGRDIGRLTKEGRKLVVEKLNTRPPVSPREAQRLGKPGRGRTGFTAQNIEAVHDPANSLYGKVRMRQGVLRPGNANERVPYIVTAVIETGRRGGFRVTRANVDLTRGRARRRSAWQTGARTQRAVFMFRNAARVLRAKTPAVLERALQRGLDT